MGIVFHWSIAGLILLQLWLGWRVSSLPAGYEKLDGYSLHAGVGLAIVTLAFFRASWRLIAPSFLPDLEVPEDFPGWQRLASELVHLALYVLMFALPLSGWLMLSAASRGEPIVLPGGIEWPAVPFARHLDFEARARLEEIAERIHTPLAFVMAGLVAMHVGAALKHQFIDRDEVLARMIPVLSRGPERPSRSARAASTAKGAR